MSKAENGVITGCGQNTCDHWTCLTCERTCDAQCNTYPPYCNTLPPECDTADCTMVTGC